MNKFKKRLQNIGLSYKKEMAILITLNIIILSISVVLFSYIKKPIIFAFLLLIDVGMNFVYLSRYKNMESNMEISLHDEFISLLPFYKTYISNGFNVYKAFQELIPFSSEQLKERIEKMITDIDEDKSIKPYINFAKKFKDNEIEQLLICIYQMVDDGNNEKYVNQFEIIFSKLRDEKYKNIIERKDKSLSSMSVFPLIGSALQIVMITFGILSTIGDMINGI
ncbi:MAG TPA: hypothetical protein DDW20_03235 [Firmicutes bacterium]|nr:hypothetical protein [Bacillota bacterium]